MRWRSTCATPTTRARPSWPRRGADGPSRGGRAAAAGGGGGRQEPGATVGVDEGLPGRVMTSGQAADGAIPVICEGTAYGVLVVEGGRAGATDLEDLAALAGELVSRGDVRARLER